MVLQFLLWKWCLLFALYGSQTWSVALRGGHGQKVYEILHFNTVQNCTDRVHGAPCAMLTFTVRMICLCYMFRYWPSAGQTSNYIRTGITEMFTIQILLNWHFILALCVCVCVCVWIAVQSNTLERCEVMVCRSHWPRGLRRRSAAARMLRSWVRNSPGAWMSVCLLGVLCVVR